MTRKKPPLGAPWAVAAALREWLKTSGRTQVDVATELGVSQPRVSRVLAGAFTDRSRVARRMCAIAHLKLPVAAGGTTDPEAYVVALRAQWGDELPDPGRLVALLRAATDVCTSSRT